MMTVYGWQSCLNMTIQTHGIQKHLRVGLPSVTVTPSAKPSVTSPEEPFCPPTRGIPSVTLPEGCGLRDPSRRQWCFRS